MNVENSEDEVPTLTVGKSKVEEWFRRIDNYELIRSLKAGGMGEVFVARHHQFKDRFYAIKVIKAGMVDDKSLARFQNEIIVAGQLKHPNIVYSYDAGR